MCLCVLVFIVVVFECAEFSCVCRLVAQRKQNKNPNFSLLISLLTNGTHGMRVCRTVNYGHTTQCLHFTYLIPLEIEIEAKINCEYVPHGKMKIRPAIYTTHNYRTRIAKQSQIVQFTEQGKKN